MEVLFFLTDVRGFVGAVVTIAPKISAANITFCKTCGTLFTKKNGEKCIFLLKRNLRGYVFSYFSMLVEAKCCLRKLAP